MKEVHTGRVTRATIQSATSTWRTVTKNGRPPIRIAVGHLAKEQTLADALDEYCQLREQDRSLTASKFCNRYPSYRHTLRRLIDVQDAMEHQPALDEENWPELFSEFLGYEIMHELGVGAIARVYLAAETAIGGRLVAVKVSQKGGDEAETLGKLTHANVVPVFSVKHDEATDMTAVCMPYHGSATLADLLEIGFELGTPPTAASVILDAVRQREQVVDFAADASEKIATDAVLLHGSYVDGVMHIGIQMAEALAYTHERGILHRDLKPSNVLLTSKGVPMLLDFNLASDMETGAQRLGGTLPYMPPEQVKDVHIQPFEADLVGDPRSDVFSLGVILYELLTGKLPFGDPPASIAPRRAAELYLEAQTQPPPSVCELNPQVSIDVANLLGRCLSLEPHKRPASATALVDELKSYFSRRQRVRRWTSRHRGAVATIALLLMSVTAAATWHLATRPSYDVRQFIAAVADIERGQITEAIVHLDEAIRLQPDSVPFRFARGVAYQRAGDHKHAEIDLSVAAEPMNDMLVMECCAYSRMKVATVTAGRRNQARYMYSRMSGLGETSADVDLNWAYANYAEAAFPLAVAKCQMALNKRPNWQEAYFLRGMAYAMTAREEMKSQPSAQATRKASRALENAIIDFERAIELGPLNEQLFYEAANVYATVDGADPSTRLKELLHSAVEYGTSTSRLQSFGRRHEYVQQPWFRDIVASVNDVAGALPDSISPDDLLFAPSNVVVNARLTADRDRLSTRRSFGR